METFGVISGKLARKGSYSLFFFITLVYLLPWCVRSVSPFSTGTNCSWEQCEPGLVLHELGKFNNAKTALLPPRSNRDIHSQIETASSKRLDGPSSTKLASSFSQGYIDLGARNPIEEGAATLAFVFDTTGSMYDDLRQVIDGAGKILGTVLEKFERPIHDYILVPFNDPDVGKMTVTSDPEEFKGSLHELQYFIQGGGDCPEMAVGAIKMALENCLPSSYVYVFTDARAKDHYLLDEVLRLIQKKHAQVVFVMTGDCGNKTHPGYKAFETIASTSSGQVFQLNKSDVDEVLNFVRLSLESRKVNLLSVDRGDHEAGKENLQLLVDKTLREFTISVSGEKPEIEIYRPEEEGKFTREERIDELLNLENVKIVGVKEPKPGRYNISVGSESKYTVRATGLSSIDFKTGFSLNPTTDIRETYHRPMKGGSSYVLVTPVDQTEFGDLFRLQLLSLDGVVLEDVALRKLPGKDPLFRGTRVEAPEEPFNIKVFGRDRNGFDFERISPTAVSSQLPFPPEVSAPERVEGHYDRPAHISCHVQTLVPFNVTWKKQGVPVGGRSQHPQSAVVSFVIERPTSEDEGVYTCLASNVAGSSLGNVLLHMKEPPPEVHISGNASFVPGKEGVLGCDVISTVAFNVTWKRYVIKGQVEDYFGQLETIGKFVALEPSTDKHRVLPNNSLWIGNISPEDDGWYRCSASNEGGKREKEVFLNVQRPPEVDVSPSLVNFEEGRDLRVKCSARGVPPPQVYWIKDGEYLPGRDPRVTLDGNTTLRVERARQEDAGEYTCLASNPAGRAEDTVALVFVQPPKVIQAGKEILVETGSTALLKCSVDGIPPPTIRWFKADSTEILPLPFIEIENGELKITGVQESDAGRYTCLASNVAGSVEDQVTLHIGSPPTVLQSPKDNTIEVGGIGGLACYGDGIPQPSIKWYREGGQPLPDHFVQDASGTLRVNEMKIEDEGTYVCVLENKYGKTEVKASLTVSGLLPPLIAAPPKPYIRVVASEAVTLPCKVVMATPPPTIKWLFEDGEIELKEGMFVTREGDLRIPSAKPHHEGRYRCDARNVAGNSSLSLHLNVLEPPKIRKGHHQQEVKFREGDRVRLRCPVGGDPKPTYSWQKNGELVKPYQRRVRIAIDGTLYIRGLKPTDAGIYVCTAINAAGATNTAVTLTVLVPPSIEEDPDSYTFPEGEEVFMPCRALGSPSPEVVWTRNGIPSSFLASHTSSDGSLRLLGTIREEGQYECHASNEVGTARRMVTLFVNKAPEINPEGDESLSVEAGEDLKLPCEVHGHPAPDVSWTKDRERVVFNETIQYFEGSYLLLKRVSPGQTGTYTCKAENRAGVDHKNFHLNVQYSPKIEVELNETKKELLEGSSVVLPCPGMSNPAPTRSWSVNGDPLIPGRGIFLESDGRVEIESVRREHSGIYECVLENAVGEDRLSYDVSIMVPPKVEQDREEPLVIEGEDVTIKCPVDAYPIPSVHWLKDGVTIFSTKDRADVTHIVVEDNGQTLHIFEASVDDQGIYRCIVSNSAGESSKEFPLKVLVPPQFADFLHDPEVVRMEGESAVFDCSVNGEPEPKVRWERDDFVYPVVHSQISGGGQRLEVGRVTPRDSGLYSCTASNAAGQTSRSFNLTVYALPSILSPSSGSPEDDLIAVQGQDARVRCRVSGIPRPTVTWSYGGAPLESVKSLTYSLHDDAQVLVLHSLIPGHSGIYYCNATNAAGSTVKSFNISVFTPPRLEEDYVTEVKRTKVTEGQRLRLDCGGEGFPSPTYTWYWESRPLSPSHVAYITQGAKLVVDKITTDNQGTYTCLAENPVGTAERHFDVQVQVPAQISREAPHIWGPGQPSSAVTQAIVNSTLTLYCPGHGNPKPSVTWTKENSDFEIRSAGKFSQPTTGPTEVTNLEGASSPGLDPLGLPLIERVKSKDDGKRLEIVRVTEEDSGVYTCTVYNEAGQDSMDFLVAVNAPPKILAKDPAPILVAVGSPLRLDCLFDGTPRPNVTWLVNGVDVEKAPLENVYVRAANAKETSLHVREVGRGHTGTYTCLVSSSSGADEVSFDVSVAMPPEAVGKIEGALYPTVVRANRPASFHCRVDAYPAPTFEWFKNEDPIDPLDDQFQFTHDQSELKLTKVSPEDSGNYSCIAVNSAGSTYVNFSLEVQVPPHLEEAPVEEITIEEGEKGELYCPITATPPPSLLWMKGAAILHRAFTSRKPRYLTISNATREDQGRYTCLATNEAGTLEQSFVVNVLVPPKLANEDEVLLEESVTLNRQITIPCYIIAEDSMKILWEKDGRPLPTLGPRLGVDSSGRRLTLTQAQPEDAGNYTCTAINRAGQLSITTSLEVLVPPVWSGEESDKKIVGIQDDQMVLKCEVDGLPPPSVLWLKDGQFLQEGASNIVYEKDGRILRIISTSERDSGRYTCVATNAAGTLERDMEVSVLVPPYRVYDPIATMKVIKNRIVTLDCPVQGKPEPQIDWYRGGQILDDEAHHLQLSNRRKHLHILRVSGEGNVTFSCVAQNSVGDLETKYFVEVLSPPTIDPSPAEAQMEVVEGQEVTLRCDVSGHPTPEVVWVTGEGMEIGGAAAPAEGVILAPDGLRLSFPSVRRRQEDSYLCLASNEAGRAEHAFRLKVNVPPVILEPVYGTSVSVTQNFPATLKCDVSNRPPTAVSWFKDGEKLTLSKDPFLYLGSSDRHLKFLHALPRHQGEYECLAENRAGKDHLLFNLTVLIPPSIAQVESFNIEKHVGESFQLNCSVEGIPPPKVSWIKGDFPLKRSERVTLFDGGQLLRVENATLEDAGPYTCVATSSIGKSELTFHTRIYKAPVIVSEGPREQKVVLGQSHSFFCKAEGNPDPVISWTRRGFTLLRLAHNDVHISSDGVELHLPRVKESDGGHYMCVAASHSGQDSKAFFLLVVVPPKIETANQPSDVTGIEQRWAELVCEAFGNPPPTVTWHRGPQPVPNGGRFQVSAEGTRLRISRLEEGDSGRYTCAATNEGGTVARNLTLRVIASPVLLPNAKTRVRVKEGSNVVIDCPIEANPTPSFSWSEDSFPLSVGGSGNLEVRDGGRRLSIVRASRSDATTYTCTGWNIAGSVQHSVELEVLVPPLIAGGNETGHHERLKVIEGGHVTFECQVTQGHPMPVRHWYKMDTGQRINDTIVNGGDKMILPSASRSDSGAFECVAENEAGASVKQFQLLVQTPPRVNLTQLFQEGVKLEDESGAESPSVLDGRPQRSTVKSYVSVIEGAPLTLPCPIEGIPTPRILWYKGGHALLPGPRIEPSTSNSALSIAEVLSKDSGIFSCVGLNPAGEAELQITLFVQGPPVFEGEPVEEKSVVSGRTLVLECRVVPVRNRPLSLGPPRQQHTDIVWTKDGEHLQKNPPESDNQVFAEDFDASNMIPTSSEISGNTSLPLKNSTAADFDSIQYIFSKDKTKLTIPRISQELDGKFACLAFNKAGKAKKTFNVQVLEAPSINTLEEIRTLEAAVGEPVVFECNASGFPPPEISWYKDENVVHPSAHLQFLEASHVLIITSVQDTDRGEYKCLATNTVGVSVETYTLDVLVPPALKGPVEERIEVVSGSSILMTCDMGGMPPPEISWSFDNDVLVESEFIKFFGSSLRISSVLPAFAGEYVCDGVNTVGRTFKVIHLFVKEVPVIAGSSQTETETASEGKAATLHCKSSGHPAPSLHWEKDGARIRLDQRLSVSWGGQSLLIQEVKLEDSGLYSCTASNSAGNDTKHYRLNVLQPPKFENGPNEVVAIQGEVVTVFCEFRGVPSPTISWYHDGSLIPEEVGGGEPVVGNGTSEVSFSDVAPPEEPAARRVVDSTTLRFSPVLPSHRGVYACEASNKAGHAEHTFPLQVLVPPKVQLELSPAVVASGESVEFSCSAQGSEPVTLSWFKGQDQLLTGQEFQISPNGTLRISSVTLDMAGTYVCSASNPAGSDEDSAVLIVYDLPRVTSKSKEVVVASGEEAELECQAEGEPQPSITWNRPDLAGKEITPQDSRVKVIGNRLIIYPVTNEDMGTYQCLATNRAGSDNANMALVVTSSPQIQEPLDEELVLLAGETINLSCTATAGYPPPSIIWSKEGRLLRESSTVSLDKNGEVVIKDIQAEDSGMYTCLVVNAAGRLYRVVHIAVQVPPKLTLLPRTQQITRGDSLRLTCEAVGTPTPTISWLLNGTEIEGVPTSEGGRGVLNIERAGKRDEGTYTCVARNDAGYRKAVAGVRVKVPPVIMQSPQEMTVQELSSVMLTCMAEGDPVPTTTWTKEGHYIASSDRVHLISNGSLVIDSSKGSDTGVYKCVASNDAGAAEAVSRLRVTTPPKISRGPLDQEVEVGETVIFDCEAEGEPLPDFQWSVSPGEMHDRFKTLTNGSLQLVAVQVEDEGEIVCQVFNDLGEDLAKANIRVKVPGQWGEWGPWSTCSRSCDEGSEVRHRACDSPPPRNGGEPCEGDDSATRSCLEQLCPVHGRWGAWLPWSECSVSCGGGVQERKRFCNNPPPLYGGTPCEGHEIEEKPCRKADCPVDGSWGNWSEWSECSKTCGEALRQRTRICNNPPPFAGGEDCKGDGLEIMACGGNPCKIDGGWSNWSEWSTCSVSCGSGVQYKRRRCDNPKPENEGKHCVGDDFEELGCNEKPCIIHGQWSSWTSWSPCSVTCGIGQRQRLRHCNNPAPKEGGDPCRGPQDESRYCRAPSCPVHGGWGSWSEWSSCSRTCDLGVRRRERQCNNPYPRRGGDPCVGSGSETMTCEDISCRDLPIRAYGTLRGWLNEQDLGVISMAGNISTNGNQRTLVISLSPLLPQFATWLTPLISIVSSAVWSSSFETDGAVNGYALTKGTFTRESHVNFESGESVDISQTARGVDESGTLRFDVEVNGNVPYLQPGSFVTVQPFAEEYIQTGMGSLYIRSNRTFAVGGHHHPYSWNETIDYVTTSGVMPSLRQTLHAKSVSASYRCLAGVENSNTRGELSLMVSSAISPSKQSTSCPEGFSLVNEGEDTPLCRDEDECILERFNCSHYCNNIVGGYTCECPRGYEIGPNRRDCEDMNECTASLNPCGPREECHNTPGSYTCTYLCRQGFRRTSGTSCEDINECEEEDVCEQRCQNLVGAYRCDCYKGFTLGSNGRCIDIDECSLYSSLCSHRCVNIPGSFECVCPKGFHLLSNGRCSDINECSSDLHNCTETERCVNFEGGYRCLANCPSGLRLGANGSCIDIDECLELSASCHFTQKCENMWGKYQCSCPTGFKSIGPGHPCIDINECHGPIPVCTYECRNLMGDYECICPPDQVRLRDRKTCVSTSFHGQSHAYQYAEEPPVAHAYYPRPHLRQRPPLPGFSTQEYHHRLLRRVYKVSKCPKGYFYKDNDCKDLNECLKPGRCQHHCENTPGSFFCTCPPGYALKEDQQNCEDIDECNSGGDFCVGDEQCFNLKGSVKCMNITCPEGYARSLEGRFCKAQCDNGTECSAGEGIYRVIYHRWFAIPPGVLAFQELLELSGVDEDGAFLPFSDFTLAKENSASPFSIKQENGKGLLSATKALEPDKEYWVTVDARSFDGETKSVLYSAQFSILLHISQYPY